MIEFIRCESSAKGSNYNIGFDCIFACVSVSFLLSILYMIDFR